MFLDFQGNQETERWHKVQKGWQGAKAKLKRFRATDLIATVSGSSEGTALGPGSYDLREALHSCTQMQPEIHLCHCPQ